MPTTPRNKFSGTTPSTDKSVRPSLRIAIILFSLLCLGALLLSFMRGRNPNPATADQAQASLAGSQPAPTENRSHTVRPARNTAPAPVQNETPGTGEPQNGSTPLATQTAAPTPPAPA